MAEKVYVWVVFKLTANEAGGGEVFSIHKTRIDALRVVEKLRTAAEADGSYHEFYYEGWRVE